jgi:molybdate transport system ATP-binding protein
VSGGDRLRVEVRRRLGDFHLNVAFEAAAEGVTALFGPSGAGKTQTLAAIAGAERPDAGRITLGEEVLFDAAARIDTPMERRRIGWVFQDGRLFPHLSVEANLRYGARRTRGSDDGGGEAAVRFEELVETLGIGALLARRPAGLSGGERQRVAIGRALLSQPRLLLMDEPLAALDAGRRADILPYLERLKTTWRLPILYVTHAVSEVVRLADRLVVLERGRVRAQGRLGEVLADDALALAPRAEAAVAVIEGRVGGHDPARGLSWIDAGPIRLATPPLAQAPGALVRAAVLARDVLLACEEPRALSARNVLAGRVERLVESDSGAVLVRVRLEGGQALWSAVTRDAAAELALSPGRSVFAIVKSLAVEGARGAGLLDALDA